MHHFFWDTLYKYKKYKYKKFKYKKYKYKYRFKYKEKEKDKYKFVTGKSPLSTPVQVQRVMFFFK